MSVTAYINNSNELILNQETHSNDCVDFDSEVCKLQSELADDSANRDATLLHSFSSEQDLWLLLGSKLVLGKPRWLDLLLQGARGSSFGGGD